MNVLDQLISIRALLTPKGAWCQGSAAKNNSGATVASISDEAVCFCLFGALTRVRHNGGDYSNDVTTIVRDELMRQGYISFSQFNDRTATTQRDVLVFLDGLIRLQIVKDQISAGGNDE